MMDIGEALRRMKRGEGALNPQPEPVYECADCQDSGVIELSPGTRNGPTEVCSKCQEKERTARLWRGSLLPEEARAKTFKAFRKRPGTIPALEAAQALAGGLWRPFLTLIGYPGAGKTHLAIAVCLHRIANGQAAQFWTAELLLRYLRDGIGQPSDSMDDYEHRSRALLLHPFLVLDDLGWQQKTPWGEVQLDELIDSRYGRELPTMVTMEPSKVALLSDRISSRIQDKRLAVVVRMEEAKDYRREG
ncbi:hypothetical protein LCGC14_1645340 [marine sediment metagenome]|uniref:IstB-like ATP-binding domain-containing protein n=1 Tax=marine sediment metagenome TaxID=412755 RepID=A0A0F9KE86_9ZZZZ